MLTKTPTQIEQMTDEQIGETLEGTDASHWHTVQAYRDGVDVTYGDSDYAKRALSTIAAIFWDSDVTVEDARVVITPKQEG